MITHRSPLLSLQEGHWFKLICGASYHHLPAIRSLALAYALAGADCIDLAADPAIVMAAKSGLQAAFQVAESSGLNHLLLPGGPWLMVSLNDGEDPHFRKAAFNPALCPAECSRPCERVCPTQAITFQAEQGVMDSRCYGCGRCIPICPFEQIYTRSYVSTPAAIAAQIFPEVDAVEIHTQIGREQAFQRLWHDIQPWVKHLKLIAISCPDGEGVVNYLWRLWDIIQPLPIPLIWQADGRPMSGDIGDGATVATVRFGQKLLSAGLPGHLQLAGGTNSHTAEKLRILGLLKMRADPLNPESSLSGQSAQISGIAYGSYARKQLMPMLEALESLTQPCVTASHELELTESGRSFDKPQRSPSFSLSEVIDLENVPELLEAAFNQAYALTSQLKMPWGPWAEPTPLLDKGKAW